VAGVTPRGAGFLGAPLIGPTAFGECAGLGLSGGRAFRAISPAKPLRSELAWGLTDGFNSVVGDKFEFVEGTFAKDSECRVLSLDFSSGVVASLSLLAPEELSKSVMDRLVPVEDGPVGLTCVAKSSGGALRDRADGLFERDSSVSGAGGFTAGVWKVFATGGVEVGEVVSPGRLGSAGERYNLTEGYQMDAVRAIVGPLGRITGEGEEVEAIKLIGFQ